MFERTLGVEPHPPWYYLFMSVWLRVGDSEAWLRLPSALCGAATAVVLVLLGRILGSAKAGWVAAVLYSASAMAIWAARDARMYAMASCLSVVSTYCLLRAIRVGSRTGWWTCYAGSLVLALFSHYLVVLVLLGQAVWCFAARFRGVLSREDLGRWMTRAAVGLSLVMAWAAWAAGHPVPPDIEMPWVLSGPSHFSWLEVGSLFFSQAYGFTLYLQRWLHYQLLIVIAVACAGLSVGTGHSAGWWLILSIPLVTCFAAVVLTHAAGMPLSERYFALVCPFFWLAVAGGLARLTAPLRVAMTAFFLIVNGVSAFNLIHQPEWGGQDLRAGAEQLQAVRSSDVVVVVPSFLRPALDYYAPDLGRRAQVIYIGKRLSPPESFDSARCPDRRVWLFLAQPGMTDPRGLVIAGLGRTHVLRDRFEVWRRNDGFIVTVLRFDPAPSI